jgi:hypothetical protein
MATHHLAAVEHEIHEFFTDFVAAFCTFDGVRIAERYHAPGIALRADGSIDVMQSHAEIEKVPAWTLLRIASANTKKKILAIT